LLLSLPCPHCQHYQSFLDLEEAEAPFRVDGAVLTPVSDAHDSAVREAFLFGRLRHPNIVVLHAFCINPTTQRLQFLVMERATCTLAHWINSRRQLTVSHFERLCRQLLLALCYLHDEFGPPRITHCDIKPDNVLIFGDGEDFTAKLGDFGCARVVMGDGVTVNVEGFNGNITYGAPEVHPEADVATTKIDVFSLGLVLVRVALNCMPDNHGVYTNLVPSPVLYEGNRSELVEAALMKMAYARNIVDLLRGCTQIDPADRLSACDALALLP
jgi:serine/threonine protein kinase